MLRYFLSFSLATLLLVGCSQDKASIERSLSESKWDLQAIVNTKTGDLELTKSSAVLKFNTSNILTISTKNKRYNLTCYLDESTGHAAISKVSPYADITARSISDIDNFELTGNCLRLINTKAGIFFVFERTK